MKILGIETSCDESAVCLIEARGNFDKDFHFQILGNSLISQIAIHAQYGGVFPNLAKREHAKNLVPLLEQTLLQSVTSCQGDALPKKIPEELQILLARERALYEKLTVFLHKYGKPEIDSIAVTIGPGLEPALWVGVNFARALALVWNVPIIAVNHMEGHLILSMMEIQPHPNYSQILKNLRIEGSMRRIQFPMLALLISGGHTELVLSERWQQYKILGATRDDAVGEAFDKVARLLGLPYPGGPQISALAKFARNDADLTQKNAEKIKLPRPMLNSGDLDFSFAGLKTAVRRLIESEGLTLLRSDLETPLRSDLESDLDAFRMQVAREFEDAVTDVLVGKTMKAVDEYGIQTVVVGGGVSANSYIRLLLAEALAKAGLPPPLVPAPGLATDNALMIALAGYFRALNKEFADPSELRANGNLKLV